MSLNSLYQEVILDHARNPRNFGPIDKDATSVRQENPSCGDQIELQLDVDADGIIQMVKFHGAGCAISQASASMMTEVIMGKTVDEAMALLQKFRRMMTEGDVEITDDMGDLEALQGVRRFPVRVRCATLSWHALEALLAEQA